MNKELPEEIKKLVDAAKVQGHAVYAIKLAGMTYYYRSINRAEFRHLQELLIKETEKVRDEAEAKKTGLKPDDPKIKQIDAWTEKEAAVIREAGEERIARQGLLYPLFGENTPAGVMSSLADRVMQASGFGSEEEPELL